MKRNKWNKYGSFKNWKNKNYDRLMNQYKANKRCGDSRRSTDDIDFDSFCLGEWQWM